MKCLSLDNIAGEQERLEFEKAQNFFNLEAVCREFNRPEERQLFFDLASRMAEINSNTNVESRCYGTSSGGFQLIPAVGLDCARSLSRNYFMALLTANAVKAYNQENGQSPTLVELGLGSGINAIAALIADPNAKVIGYEYDEEAIKFFESLNLPQNIKERIEIRKENFLLADMSDIKADIVINENIEPSLSQEPLFQAANKILPCTHEKTLFVPGGLQFYFLFSNSRGDKLRFNTTYVDFKHSIQNPIRMGYIFDKEQDKDELNRMMHSNHQIFCSLGYDITNYNTDVVYSSQENEQIKEMPIGTFTFSIKSKKMNKRSICRLRVGFDYVHKGVYGDRGLIIHKGRIVSLPRDIDVYFEKMTVINRAFERLRFKYAQ